MKAKVLLLSIILLFAAGCTVHGPVKKQAAPGQVQKHTGYNPASGKVKTR